MKHMYIHIPFCHNICSYCDFCKMFYSDTYADKYLDALDKEVEEYYMNEEMETLYIGGGTPSALSLKQIDRLFEIINKVKLKQGAEVTFECNPQDITEELIDKLIFYKVNRLSIGIESFNKNKLKFMERTSNFKDILSKIQMIKSKGILNINVDLIYGIPGESLRVLKDDLKLMLKLKPTHISTYSLIIEKHTKISLLEVKNIDENLEYDMYKLICRKLKKYKHYEVSNFALDGYESEHNMSYWKNEEYYGFGLGASGYVNGFRYDNTKNMNKYLNGEYHLQTSLLSKEEIMDYELMLGLRMFKGINVEEFYDKYGVNIQDAYPVKPLIKSEELIYNNGYLYVNPKYMYVMNEILMKIV